MVTSTAGARLENLILTKNGFVDIQVNGIVGIDFGAPGLTMDKVRKAVGEIVARGTIAFCPTIVTASEDLYRENLPVLARAMDDPQLGGHILGVHVEGPFISPVPGPRGAHQERYVRPPSIAEFDDMMDYASGKIAILTLAPEMPGAEDLIRHAVSMGVIVALGHHYADAESLARAVAAGAKLATHLGNGITAQIDRHNNPIWWQLACDDLWATFVTDGHHLPAPYIKTALRAKTLERFIAISDAVQLAGMPAGAYEFFGTRVVLEEGGRLYIQETGYLAGSSSVMLQCMNHLASLRLLSEDDLWRVGRGNPLALLGVAEDEISRLSGPNVSWADGCFSLA